MSRTGLALSLMLGWAWLAAQVQELPDVEISGVSPLKTTLSHTGQLNPQDLHTDITDSLHVLVPLPINPTTEALLRQKKALVRLDLDTRLGNYLAVLLPAPYQSVSALGFIHRQLKPAAGWDYRELQAFAQHVLGSWQSRLGLELQHTVIAVNLHEQHLFTVSAHNQLDVAKWQDVPLAIDWQTYLHLLSISETSTLDSHLPLDWDNALRFDFQVKADLQASTACAVFQKQWMFGINLERIASENGLDSPLIRSVGLVATKQRLVPEIAFLKRWQLLPDWDMVVSQLPGRTVTDLSHSLSGQPWQSLPLRHPFAFNPLNLQLSSHNSMFSTPTEKWRLTLSTGAVYWVDKTIWTQPPASATGKLLPEITAAPTLETNLTTALEYQTSSWLYRQNLTLQRGWLAAQDYALLPYFPLFKADTQVSRSWSHWSAFTSFGQSYSTLAEDHAYLRETLDLSAGCSYRWTSNTDISLNILNALNRGSILHILLPQQPVTLQLSLNHLF